MSCGPFIPSFFSAVPYRQYEVCFPDIWGAYDSHSISSSTYCLSLWFFRPFSGYLFSWIRIYSQVLCAHFFSWELHMGEYFVTGCGVDLYPMSIYILDRSATWLAFAMCCLFRRWELSASPFARRCSGVTRWCINPIFSANALNSTELKGGPLSLSSPSGIPCVCKYFSQPVANYPTRCLSSLYQDGQSCLLVDHYKIGVTIGVLFSIVDGDCVPRCLWNFRWLNRLLFVLDCSVLALEASWYSIFDHAAESPQPVLSS